MTAIAEKVKQESLLEPIAIGEKIVKAAATVSQGPLSYEQSIAKKAADKKHEEYASRWGDYMWIQRQAKTLEKSEEEMAKMMGLEEAYAMFSKPQVSTQVVQDKQVCTT